MRLITLTRVGGLGLVVSEEGRGSCQCEGVWASLLPERRNSRCGQRLSVLQIDVRDKLSTSNLES